MDTDNVGTRPSPWVVRPRWASSLTRRLRHPRNSHSHETTPSGHTISLALSPESSTQTDSLKGYQPCATAQGSVSANGTVGSVMCAQKQHPLTRVPARVNATCPMRAIRQRALCAPMHHMHEGSVAPGDTHTAQHWHMCMQSNASRRVVLGSGTLSSIGARATQWGPGVSRAIPVVILPHSCTGDRHSRGTSAGQPSTPSAPPRPQPS